jgi:hypothetical protein
VFTARYGLNLYIQINFCLIRVNDNFVSSKQIATLTLELLI